MIQSTATEQQIYAWFEHFHNHPEISWHETETTKTIAAILQELNISHYMFDDVTGVIAEIGEGEEVIAVRADIDALWQEVNGVMQANHSCGHDANISMVLGALLQLKDESFRKRIRFIFQPAEEQGGGALAMIERGVIEDMTQLYGVHLRPAEELPFGKVTPAIHHGAAVFLKGTIRGADAHGARPHQGKSAIDILFAIQQMLKSVYIDPFEVYSVKMTKMVADGGSINVIPGNATFSIDVRAQKNEILAVIQERLVVGFAGISAMYGTEIDYEWIDETPGAEVSQQAANIAEAAIVSELGADFLAPQVHTPGSDDFHFYTIKNRELQATMIGIGADLTPGLHHPMMTFKKEALVVGARALAATLRKAAQ